MTDVELWGLSDWSLRYRLVGTDCDGHKSFENTSNNDSIMFLYFASIIY